MNTTGFLVRGFVIAGMEACWLFALLHLLHAKIGSTVPGTEILGLYAISYAYYSWVPWLQNRRFLRELTGWLLWAVLLFGWTAFAYSSSEMGVLATVRSVLDLHFRQGRFLILGAGGALWFMGRRLGRLRTDFSLCLGEFQFGLVLLVIIYYMDAQFGIPLAPLVPLTIGFFVLGLTGLSITQVQKAGVSGRSRLGLLSGSLGVVLLIALWIFFVMKPELLAAVLHLLTEFGRSVVLVATRLIHLFIDAVVAIGTPIVRFLGRLLHYLAWLIPGTDRSPLPGVNMQSKKDKLDAIKMIHVPDWVATSLKVLVIAGLVILFALLLWWLSARVLKWLRRPKVFSPGAERQALPGAFRGDFLRLLRAARDGVLAFIRRFRLRTGRIALDSGTAGIRQAYMTLLAMGAGGGCPRKPAMTPDEHLEALTAWLPEAQCEIILLTQQYVQARYGLGVAEKETLRELTHCLQTVQHLCRKKKRQRLFRKIHLAGSSLAAGAVKGAELLFKRPYAKA